METRGLEDLSGCLGESVEHRSVIGLQYDRWAAERSTLVRLIGMVWLCSLAMFTCSDAVD